jgi:LPXTG-site transpeptidase (sortase) family protein
LYLARHRRTPLGRWALGLALAAAVLCAGGIAVAAFGLLDGTPAHAGAQLTPASVTTAPPKLSHDPKARVLARSLPVSIRVPAIGVSAPVQEVGDNADGTVQVPPLDSPNLTGWYKYGPTPGQPGDSVILGHVDTASGISVFYYLRDLKAGDKIYVTLTDGKVATFEVDGLQKVPKDAFPTASVYGKSGYASLRLITCGGTFDEATGHYLYNIIVYAHLIAAAT